MKGVFGRHRILTVFAFALFSLYSSGTIRAESAKGTWDTQFKLPPGLNGSVSSVVSIGSDLYVGGAFTKAGTVQAIGIAKWDGTNWSSVGGGVDGSVSALAVSGTHIYVGGQFDRAGATGATNIISWNGTNWEALGEGVNGPVYSLFASGSDLYVGGEFVTAGGISAYNIARWDGSAWHAMDTGVYIPPLAYPWGWVTCIAGDGMNIYAGGVFSQAGSAASTNLARWNGSSWDSIGNPFGGQTEITYEGLPHYGLVKALSVDNGLLYVGGDFDGIGGISASNLARWDGTNWGNVGNVSGQVNSIESFTGSLYIGGTFAGVGGIAASNLAVITNGNWSALDVDLHSLESVTTTRHIGPKIYVGGNFAWANGVSAANIIEYDGTNWSAMGNGVGNSLGGTATSLATDGANIFAAGIFSTAGTNAASGLAKWDGTNWARVGNLISGHGSQVTVIGSNVFLSGSFEIPEVGATNLAEWNGSEWASIGSPFQGTYRVDAMTAVGEQLYVAGLFTDSSNNLVFACSGWNGTNWNLLVNGAAFKLATDQTNLYLAEGTGTGGTIRKWDGTTLAYLGGKIPIEPLAIAASGTNLYVAGILDQSNNVPAIFSWDGAKWSDLGFPGTGNINAILPVRGKLYVGGQFDSVGEIQANSTVEWTGTNWCPLESGVTYDTSFGYVQSMVCLRRKIFVAGEFDSAGNQDSGNFAVWNEAPDIRLANINFQPGGPFAFDVCGIPGDEIGIEASDTLGSWTNVGSFMLSTDKGQFSEAPPPNSAHRFFRARLLNN